MSYFETLGVGMQLDAKKFFFAFFFFIATLITLGYYHFNHEQTLINQNINTTLEQAVKSASVLIGDRYQERVLTTPPSAVDDADTINALTSLAHTQGVEYLYSLVLDNSGKLHFTSTSARNHGVTSSQNLIHFFDVYPTNPEIIKALKNNKIVWDTKDNSDQTGKFRSLYIPYTTPSGLHYVIGADIEVGSIKKLSNAAAFKSIASSFVIFLGALPFLIIYRNKIGRAHV